MVLVSALFLLAISGVGGAVLWLAKDVLDKRKKQKYQRWRSQWRLIKGGLDGNPE